MSRPKIGSVTEAVSENGTRFCQSSTVSQAVASEPATPRAKRTTSPASTHVAIGLRSGMSSAFQATRVERRSSGGLQRRAPPGAPDLRGLGRLVEPLEQVAHRPAPGDRRRRQAAGEPQVAEQHDQRQHEPEREQPDLRGDPRPVHVRVPDALEPQRVGPDLDAEREERDQRQDDERRQPDPERRDRRGGGGSRSHRRRSDRRAFRRGSAAAADRPNPRHPPRRRRRPRGRDRPSRHRRRLRHHRAREPARSSVAVGERRRRDLPLALRPRDDAARP